MAARGYHPDLICAHPGWGEALFLKELWPDAIQLHYLEFFYRSQGQDMGFDPEFGVPDLAARARLTAKNANNLLNLSLMDAGVCPTQWQLSTLPAQYQTSVQVIHDGIDTARLQPDPGASVTLQDDQGRALRLAAGDQLVTYVGRNLEPFRGYHQFMRALPAILKACPDARAVIVGGDGVSYGAAPEQGSWKNRFLEEVRGQLDMSRVHFVGKLPYSSFVQVLQRSTVHVYLTYPFVLSWSLLEAMSLEAMVVASDTAPVREVIRDGHNGWLVNFFQPEALAERVVQCLRDAPRLANVRRAARQTVVQGYDLRTRCLPQQIELVSALLERR